MNLFTAIISILSFASVLVFADKNEAIKEHDNTSREKTIDTTAPKRADTYLKFLEYDNPNAKFTKRGHNRAQKRVKKHKRARWNSLSQTL
jgi:hypothetical protein